MIPALAPPAPLRDGDVELLPLDGGVADLVLAGSNDEQVTRWTQVPAGLTAWDARLVTAGWLGTQARTVRLQVRTDELGPVGMVTIWIGADGEAEVGYWLLARARGKGVGRRAVRLLCDWALESGGVDRLQLTTLPGNAASERVAAGCGFTRAHTVERDIKGTVCTLQLWLREAGPTA